jgi:hypothetical protein
MAVVNWILEEGEAGRIETPVRATVKREVL